MTKIARCRPAAAGKNREINQTTTVHHVHDRENDIVKNYDATEQVGYGRVEVFRGKGFVRGFRLSWSRNLWILIPHL